MGLLTKIYTFVPKVTINASEVNRNFDDLYAGINGNLNSANIDSNITFAASKITIDDTASVFTSCFVEGALQELKSDIQNQVIIEFSDGLVGNIGSSCQIYAGHVTTIDEPGITSSELLALYHFQSASMTSDEVGVYNLINAGSDTIQNGSGIFGSGCAAIFVGDSGTIYTQPTLLDAAPAGLAISFWAKFDTGSPTATEYIFYKENVSGTDYFYIALEPSGTLKFYLEENNSGIGTVISGRLYDSATATPWTHIVCSLDTTYGMRMWMDSVLVGALPSASTMFGNGTDGDFTIGAQGGTKNNGFAGQIANVSILSKELTQKDVDLMYSVKYSHPASFSSLNYKLSAKVREGGIESFERQFDITELEVARNLSSVYIAGGLITGLTASDRLYIAAGG